MARLHAPTIAARRIARPGAPKAPSQADLSRLFAAAWYAASPARRPKPQAFERLAADVMLVGDAEIAELNAQHMRHDGPTDVLSFPMGEPDFERKAYFLGEIVASHETAAREAAARGLEPRDELARYCVHGFLHLLGYEDGTPARRKAMEAVQEQALGAWGGTSTTKNSTNFKRQKAKGKPRLRSGQPPAAKDQRLRGV